MVKLIAAFTTAFVLTIVPAHAGTVASAAKKGTPIGYAKADIAVGTVITWGGRGTTGVSVNGFGPGAVSLTFNGKYPDDIDTNKIVLAMSTQAYAYGVANGEVIAASPTQIVVNVYHFQSDTQNDLSGDVFVTLLVGN